MMPLTASPVEEEVVGLPVAVERGLRQPGRRPVAGGRRRRRRPPPPRAPIASPPGSPRPPAGRRRAPRRPRPAPMATVPSCTTNPACGCGAAVGEIGRRHVQARQRGARRGRVGLGHERVPAVGPGVDVVPRGRLVQLVPVAAVLDQAERPRGGHAAIGEVVREPVLPRQLVERPSHGRLALEIDVAPRRPAARNREEPAPMAGHHGRARAEHGRTPRRPQSDPSSGR